MSVSSEIAIRHFGRKAVTALSRKGITLMSLVVIPDMSKPMPFASGETGYSINDNGCGRIWTYAEVVEAAR